MSTPSLSADTPDATAVSALRDPSVIRQVRPFGEEPADLLIDQGRVVGVYPARLRGVLDALLPGRTRSIDGADAVALPAFIDLHTHLREPGGEEQETITSGLAAAAAGGFTRVFAMANTDPVTDTPERVAWIRERSHGIGPVAVSPVGAVTRGLAGRELAELDAMADEGVTLFSDDGRCVDDAGLMRQALAFAARRGVAIAQHSQSTGIAALGQVNAGPVADRLGLVPWPASAEAAIIARDAVLAAETGGHLHVAHVSTALAVEVIAWAKAQGWPVTAEVTPHHLLLSDDFAAFGDARFKVNPPLRAASDVRALRDALAEGILDTIGTDHAPHTERTKSCGWARAAFGMSGLETALAAVAEAFADEHRLDWRMLSTRLTDAPGRIGGLASTDVPALCAGARADIVLVDDRGGEPLRPASLLSRGKNTPFPGMVFHHSVSAVFLGGRRVA